MVLESVLIFCDNIGDLVGSYSAVNVIVDCENGSKTASADAAASLNGEVKVSCAFAGSNSENLADFVKNFL